MITIYHNNRCSKSRSGLEILKNSGKEYKIINYLENIPNTADLTRIINLLKINPLDLVRKNEAIWKENYKGKILTNAEVIDAMTKYPKLIERPIVIKGNKAVIGRPPELILDLIT
ncbi:arsenate reductase (glutaredoxin) [Lacinutrix sp. MEBiC02595]